MPTRGGTNAKKAEDSNCFAYVAGLQGKVKKKALVATFAQYGKIVEVKQVLGKCRIQYQNADSVDKLLSRSTPLLFFNQPLVITRDVNPQQPPLKSGQTGHPKPTLKPNAKKPAKRKTPSDADGRNNANNNKSKRAKLSFPEPIFIQTVEKGGSSKMPTKYDPNTYYARLDRLPPNVEHIDIIQALSHCGRLKESELWNDPSSKNPFAIVAFSKEGLTKATSRQARIRGSAILITQKSYTDILKLRQNSSETPAARHSSQSGKEDVEAMSLNMIKDRLKAMNVDFRSCKRKVDFTKLLRTELNKRSKNGATESSTKKKTETTLPKPSDNKTEKKTTAGENLQPAADIRDPLNIKALRQEGRLAPEMLKVLNFSNYYDFLGVSEDCNEQDMKKAYRSAALRYHPDRCKLKGITEVFKAITSVRDYLGTITSRKQYTNLLRRYKAVNAPQKLNRKIVSAKKAAPNENEFKRKAATSSSTRAANSAGGGKGTTSEKLYQVFVGDLPLGEPKVTKEELRTHFSRFGQLLRVTLGQDENECYAMLYFDSQKAKDAILLKTPGIRVAFRGKPVRVAEFYQPPVKDSVVEAKTRSQSRAEERPKRVTPSPAAAKRESSTKRKREVETRREKRPERPHSTRSPRSKGKEHDSLSRSSHSRRERERDRDRDRTRERSRRDRDRERDRDRDRDREKDRDRDRDRDRERDRDRDRDRLPRSSRRDSKSSSSRRDKRSSSLDKKLREDFDTPYLVMAVNIKETIGGKVSFTMAHLEAGFREHGEIKRVLTPLPVTKEIGSVAFCTYKSKESFRKCIHANSIMINGVLVTVLDAGCSAARTVWIENLPQLATDSDIVECITKNDARIVESISRWGENTQMGTTVAEVVLEDISQKVRILYHYVTKQATIKTAAGRHDITFWGRPNPEIGHQLLAKENLVTPIESSVVSSSPKPPDVSVLDKTLDSIQNGDPLGFQKNISLLESSLPFHTYWLYGIDFMDKMAIMLPLVTELREQTVRKVYNENRMDLALLDSMEIMTDILTKAVAKGKSGILSLSEMRFDEKWGVKLLKLLGQDEQSLKTIDGSAFVQWELFQYYIKRAKGKIKEKEVVDLEQPELPNHSISHQAAPSQFAPQPEKAAHTFVAQPEEAASATQDYVTTADGVSESFSVPIFHDPVSELVYYVNQNFKAPNTNIPPAKHKELLISVESVLNVDAVEISDLSWKSCCQVLAPLVYLAKHYYDPAHMKDLKLWEKVCILMAFEQNCLIRKRFNMMVKEGNHAMLRCAKAFARHNLKSFSNNYDEVDVLIRACKDTLDEIDPSGHFRRKVDVFFA